MYSGYVRDLPASTKLANEERAIREILLENPTVYWVNRLMVILREQADEVIRRLADGTLTTDTVGELINELRNIFRKQDDLLMRFKAKWDKGETYG